MYLIFCRISGRGVFFLEDEFWYYRKEHYCMNFKTDFNATVKLKRLLRLFFGFLCVWFLFHFSLYYIFYVCIEDVRIWFCSFFSWWRCVEYTFYACVTEWGLLSKNVSDETHREHRNYSILEWVTHRSQISEKEVSHWLCCLPFLTSR